MYVLLSIGEMVYVLRSNGEGVYVLLSIGEMVYVMRSNGEGVYVLLSTKLVLKYRPN